jgi:GntR family transcriptional regulator, vanillate catabolism transcriptional regulator
MSPDDPTKLVRADGESQTLRALVEMRELLIRGEFKAGERIREIPLAERLGVSRTPLRLVLDRLEHEGLLKARPRGGFVARQFSLEEVLDVIELRGVLEGTAVRMAAARLESDDELAEMRACIEGIDRVTDRCPTHVDAAVGYIPLNERFHAVMLDLAKSTIVRRSMEQIQMLPFSSPNAFATSELESAEWIDSVTVSQWQHRAIVEALTDRDGGRAESVAREHARLARRHVLTAYNERKIHGLRGGPLVRIPEAV